MTNYEEYMKTMNPTLLSDLILASDCEHCPLKCNCKIPTTPNECNERLEKWLSEEFKDFETSPSKLIAKELEDVFTGDIKEILKPEYYGGSDNPYEAIKIIEALGLGTGFNIGNVIKYISRAGKKDGNTRNQDLKKALYYLNREIKNYDKTI